MNEISPTRPAASTQKVRRKALADWLMETSSLFVVFMICEPAAKYFVSGAAASEHSLSSWYYLLVLVVAVTSFVAGMRLHREP